MSQDYVELSVAGKTFRGRILDDRSPSAARALRARLPLDASLVLDEWSGFIARIRLSIPLVTTGGDPIVAFAHPGLVMLDPANGDLAICFGQGRLQNGLGPIPALPLIEVGGDIEAFRPIGIRLQYDGAARLRIGYSADQTSPVAPPRRERGRRISIELGEARAVADLLEESAPVTAASLVAKLPLAGVGTNTFVSGPLIRLRGGDGSDAELPLDSAPAEMTHTILQPGYIYYRPIQPRGLRIAAREATTMGGGVLGMNARLVPLARLTGDWARFRDVANALRETGMRPLRITLEG